MTSRELLEILRGFRGLNLIGADVVEVSPAYDHAEITGVAASHVAYDLVSLLAMRHEETGDMTRNGGDVVVETLTALGVSHVFGIPGQHALGLFDAIRRSDLTFVSSRVENNSAFGADGYARATGEVGVLFLSTGPGALTALGALQEAYATGVPLLVITSQVPRAGLGLRRGMLHQLDDQQRSAVNVTKSTAVARNPAEIPSLLADAWSLAQSAPAGPTWVEIPQDVLLEPTDVPAVTSVVTAVTDRPPRAELVDAAAALLNAAQRPVILAGGGVRRSRGGPEALVALANCLTRRWFRRSAARAPSGSTTRCRRPRGSRTATPPRCWRTPMCCWPSAPRWAR